MTSPDQPPTPPGVTDAPDAPPPRAARQSLRSWLIAGAVTAIVAVAAAVFLTRSDETGVNAAADPYEQDTLTGQPGFPGAGGGFGPGAAGEVVAVDGSTLTVERTDQDGNTDTIAVQTSDDTTVTETVDGDLDDLSVGDDVVVTGEEADDGITARSINVGGTAGLGGGLRGGGQPPEGFEPPEDFEPPEGFEPPDGGARPDIGSGFASGEIVSIDGSAITIQTSEGATVQVTAADDVTVRLTETRSVSDIEVGDTILAVGATEDSVVSATAITIGDLGFGRGGPGGQPGTEGR